MGSSGTPLTPAQRVKPTQCFVRTPKVAARYTRVHTLPDSRIAFIAIVPLLFLSSFEATGFANGVT